MKIAKRTVACCLSFVVLLVACAGFAEIALGDPSLSEGLLGEEEAIALASNALDAQGISTDSLSIREVKATFCIRTENSQPLWVVSVFVANEPPPYATVEIDASSGAVGGVRTGDIRVYYATWEAEKGPSDGWTLEDKALFDTLYCESDRIPRNVMPGEDDLPLEEALKIGMEALSAEHGVNAEDVAEYTYSLMCGNEKPGENVWLIKFFLSAEQGGRFYQVNVSAQDGVVHLIVDDKNAKS